MNDAHLDAMIAGLRTTLTALGSEIAGLVTAVRELDMRLTRVERALTRPLVVSPVPHDSESE